MKILKILRNLIIILLVIILVFVMYLKFIKKEELISLFGRSFLIVSTGSMVPEIDSGELIIIEKMDKYYVGDIVTYSEDSSFFITHRIKEIQNGKFIAKGDSNNINDDIKDVDSIRGKVIFHSKILGKFVLYYLKPVIFIYIFLNILIYCVLCMLDIKEIEAKQNRFEKDKNIKSDEKIALKK